MGCRAAVVGAVDGARARAPYTPYASDGASVRTVLDEQIPAFEARAAAPAGPFDLGCLYIGTNDVRGFDWDPFAYEAALRRGARAGSARAASAR